MDLDPYESLRAGSGRIASASGSSAWATSACRWRWPSPARGSRSWGSTSTRPRSSGSARGESYIGHIPGRIDPRRSPAASRRRTDFQRLDEPDAILICVPTPLSPTREPDLAYVAASARAIAARLRPGQLVVLESTTYPGTTRQVVLPDPRSRRAARPGATSSSPTAPSARTRAIPRYSAADDPQGRRRPRRPQPRAGRRALRRRSWSGSCPSPACEVAEACKILENTYRAVNIALVNELKLLYDRMGIDVWEVIEAAKTKPFGFQAFYPGPGPRRALHPDRPVLPDVDRARARDDDAVHRAGRRDQHGDARLRGRPGRRRPQRPRQAASRGAGSSCWAWPTRRTSTTPASRPASS